MAAIKTTTPDEVIAFWREAGTRGLWFRKDEAFDRDFRDRFAAAHMAAARRELDAWASSAEGLLALLILLDQYPRNAYRGTGHMYATDALARHFARLAIERGVHEAVEPALRLFWCLPFAHSEDAADQHLSVELSTRHTPDALSHAIDHRDIVLRFGRFPHRNPMLGRETTAEEAAFLQAGGFAG
jgi:uncharacterized protein (DUF924 family)